MNMPMNWICRLALVLCFCYAQATLQATVAESGLPVRQQSTTSTATLQQLSSSLVAISRQVEPAVVQIFNSAYEIGGEGNPLNGRVVSQERSSGSGVLIADHSSRTYNDEALRGGGGNAHRPTRGHWLCTCIHMRRCM